jgi:hypothetical protein
VAEVMASRIAIKASKPGYQAIDAKDHPGKQSGHAEGRGRMEMKVQIIADYHETQDRGKKLDSDSGKPEILPVVAS